MRAGLWAAITVALAAVAGAAWADLTSVMVDFDDRQDHVRVVAGAKVAGVELIMRRATRGVGDIDANLPATLKAAREAKLLSGAYHVIYPMDSSSDDAHRGVTQAREFVRGIAGACTAGQHMLLAVDWERPARGGALLAPASPGVVADFVAEVTRLTGAGVVVYTNTQTLAQYAGQVPPSLGAQPLWLATYHRMIRYDTDPTQVSVDASDEAVTIRLARGRFDTLSAPAREQYAPWTTMTFWQFSEGGANDASNPQGRARWAPIYALEPQIQGVDTSWYLGTREAFRAWYARTAWKCRPALATSPLN